VFRGDGIELQSVMTSERPSLGGGISDKSAFIGHGESSTWSIFALQLSKCRIRRGKKESFKSTSEPINQNQSTFKWDGERERKNN
jgi:hypothetical protein